MSEWDFSQSQPAHSEDPWVPIAVDPVLALIRMAVAYGHATRPEEVLAEPGREAGTVTDPLRDSAEVTPEAAAAYTLVLREAGPSHWDTPRSISRRERAVRLLYACRLALGFTPVVAQDRFERFVLGLDAGAAPPVVRLELSAESAATRLRDYLAEHDSGSWTCPNVLAGALADLHDAVRLVVIWEELWGGR